MVVGQVTVGVTAQVSASLVGVECCCPARVTLFSLLDLGAASRAGHCPCNTPRHPDPSLGASTQEVLELSQKSLLKTA